MKHSEAHIKRPFLVNAREMARQHPKTFQCPNDADCAELVRVGSFVKVCHDCERFWVQVTEVRPGGVLLGKIDNHLMCAGERLVRGEIIQFCTANIYDITNVD